VPDSGVGEHPDPSTAETLQFRWEENWTTAQLPRLVPDSGVGQHLDPSMVETLQLGWEENQTMFPELPHQMLVLSFCL
jgi:hypothetical protein